VNNDVGLDVLRGRLADPGFEIIPFKVIEKIGSIEKVRAEIVARLRGGKDPKT
jgi:hypothetical protein